MPLFAFKKEFEEDIRSGVKTSTMRAQGNQPGPRARPGDLLHLYSGRYTSKDYHKIGIARVDLITRVRIFVDYGKPVLLTAGYKTPEAEPHLYASFEELKALADKEGFAYPSSLFAFFDLEKKGEFNGWLYDFTLIEESPRR